MSNFVIVAALAAQIASNQTTVTKEEVASPAMVAALANKVRVKTAPSFVKEPAYLRPDAARLKGEFGEVVLRGIIGADGRFAEARIETSSRSPEIDAAALASVPMMLFQPARDAGGQPLSIPATLPLEYSQVDFRGPRGLGQYRCAQFVRDYDWWYRTWPADKHDRIFLTVRGYVVIADMRSGKKIGDFGPEWKQAIEACRNAPDKLMLDMLKPHGPFIRDMLQR